MTTTSGAAVTVPVESPALFRSGDDELFGILTQPAVDANGWTVIHVNGKGASASTVGRGRISVLLARGFAARGFHGFRLDWRGTGESTGAERQWHLKEALPLAELRDGIGWLHEQGLHDHVLVGTCGGARVALETAVGTVGVRGVALLNMPVRDYDRDKRFESMPLRHIARRLLRRQTLRDLRDRQRLSRYVSRARRKMTFMAGKLKDRGRSAPGGQFERVGPRLLGALEALTAAQVPVLVFYGSDDDDYRDWVRACEGPLGRIVNSPSSVVRTEVVAGRYYDRSSRQLTEEVVRAVETHLVPAIGR